MPDDSIAWYRVHICETERHKHGAEGELQCMMERYLRLRKPGTASTLG
jgi:hypothetical protein